MDEAWRAELAELIAIPSVSADPAHREDVKRAGEWVCELIRRIGGTAELTPFGERELVLGEIPASSDPGERADRPRLQPLRRPAARAARAVGVGPVRARDPRRVGVRARRRRRQGPALARPQGRAAARRGERAAGQSPHRVRRRGGGRRPHDRRLGRAGRARRRRVRDLRRRDAAPRRADHRARDARSRRRRRQGAHRRARPALRDVRRRRRSTRSTCSCGASTRCLPARTGCCPSRCAQGIAAPTAEELDAWSKLPSGAEAISRRGRKAARRERGRGVLRPHVGGAVDGRERDHRRQAGRSQHDPQRRGVRRVLDPPRAGAGCRDHRRRGGCPAASRRLRRGQRSRSS